ncbi:phosphonate metabolism protein/1,5-bisphosphokinase (PRPP-forming) PhnN [Actibacterium lipolyticum]|uniref:Ribose 1,5-bisphosphate phosphokinase PhnN n=1 Tax=Actibacterium lipolyticum TaxID=1524263 RepID=A0A238JXA0_9RHOB|nr:phosphonate metabolism protein/1,5-bisphosphokinase (PRPP-forming) PhnN [Actibacterium lipolyticum]SMX34336.1 Ribose 1,5-bisphosphate phosphokinase PhnN [Actibacterium lipolyticum]
MRGRLFAVVGPSGAGKDTLMEAALGQRPDLHLVRRVITRPTDAGGEAFDGVSEAEFEQMRQAGGLALHWQAHGLSYGIPENINAALGRGQDVVFNGSRGVLAEANRRYPGLIVLHITASIPTLAARLAARGRETERDIANRLKRASYGLPAGVNVRVIQNDGALSDAVAQLLDALQPERV